MEQKIFYYFNYSKSNHLVSNAKVTFQNAFKDRSVAKITPYLASMLNELQQQVITYTKPVFNSRIQLNTSLTVHPTKTVLSQADQIRVFNQQALKDYESILVAGFPAFNEVSSVKQCSEQNVSVSESTNFQNTYIANQVEKLNATSNVASSYLKMKEVNFLQCCLGKGYCTAIDEQILHALIDEIKAIASGNSDVSFFELFESLRIKMAINGEQVLNRI